MKRIGPMAVVLAAVAAMAPAKAFEKTYDPLKALGIKQTSPADPENAGQTLLGAKLYAMHCASCHGAALEGAENWQDNNEDGTYKPPPHDDSGHTWHHSDKVLFEYTKLGGEKLFEDYPDIISAMPGFGDELSDDEIWSILAFIKSNWSDEMRESQKMASKYDPLPDEYLDGRDGMSVPKALSR